MSCHENFFYIGGVGVFPVKLSAYQVSMVLYLTWYWIACFMPSVISFAHFTDFSNLNIFGNIADISKRQMTFLFFHRILCDVPKNSRSKNFIIVVLNCSCL